MKTKTRSKTIKRKSVQIVVCPETGRRLCYDNKWRNFANFGGFPECVKVFKYPAAALKAGAKHRIRPAKAGETISTIIHLYDGDSMDAAGKVTRKNESKEKTQFEEKKIPAGEDPFQAEAATTS